jgi:hypothetical protein
MSLKNKNKQLLILFLLISLFVKIDFRLKPELECCNDDHDYYIHAETTIIDFDFEYDNQLEGFEKSRNFINGKSSPVGFYGTGLLSSPFLLIGNIVDKVFDLGEQKLYSNKVIYYSFSSIFYLLFTLLIFKKINILLNKPITDMKLLIILLGTGLPYYALERYSMTHVYDTFSITCLIYFLISFYKEGNNKSIFGSSIFFLITLITRWTNYQIFFLPFIIQKLFFPNSKNRIRNNYWFYIFSTFSTLLFLLHTKLIWGIYTFNPRKLYNDHEFISYYLNSLIESPLNFIFKNITDAITTLFTHEFGVFWFSPVIFFGVIFIFIAKKITFKIRLSIFIIFSYYFSLVNAWQSTGNAYGFRYLYPLISLSVLLFFHFKKENLRFYKVIEKYLLIFSIFSIISVLFFEGWEGSQLSLIPIENSFGKVEKFVQPNYLTGLLKGFLIIDTYIKILTTSFLSLICFRFLLYFFEISELNNFLNKFSLPVDNSDFQLFLTKVESLTLFSYFSILILLYLATYTLFYILKK